MANLIGKARLALRLLHSIRDETRALERVRFPGAGGNGQQQVDLGEIRRDLKDVKRALVPSAADQRSVL